MLFDFCAWFDCSDHADVLLRLSQPASEDPQPAETSNSRKRPRDEEQGVDASDAPKHSTGPTASAVDSSAQQADKALQQVQPARVYSLHAVLLARHSAWFKTALSKSWQQPACTMQHNDIISGSPTSAIRHELPMHVQPDEVEAADLLLRLIYGFDPPARSSDNLPLLFTCLRLADRFDSPDCVDLLLRHIKDATADISMVRYVYCAPPGVQDRPIHKQLLNSCKGAILQMYGIVPSVIRDEQLLQNFCSLPFAAVLAWAESDGLKVQSENCMVYLLSAWVKAAQEEGGQGVSNEQLEQLTQQVRVLNLGPAYQQHILPQLEWFKGCSGMAWLPSLYTYKQWETSQESVWTSRHLDFVRSESERTRLREQFSDLWEGPKQWLANSRRRAPMTYADRIMRWEVGGEQLQELYDGEVCGSPTIYMCGFHMRIQAKAYSTRDDQARTFGMFFAAHSSQVHNTISWPVNAALPVGDVTLKVLGSKEGGAEAIVTAECDIFSRCMQGSCGRGSWDILARSAPTMRELLTPYLRDGKLHLEARFTYVDCP